MIVVHHLNQSRSQRILWLLEELGLPYDIAYYERDTHKMAPEALRSIHPLGKSPIITDGSRVVFLSDATGSFDYPDVGYGAMSGEEVHRATLCILTFSTAHVMTVDELKARVVLGAPAGHMRAA